MGAVEIHHQNIAFHSIERHWILYMICLYLPERVLIVEYSMNLFLG